MKLGLGPYLLMTIRLYVVLLAHPLAPSFLPFTRRWWAWCWEES